MGLLDKLTRKGLQELRDTVRDAVESVVEDATGIDLDKAQSVNGGGVRGETFAERAAEVLDERNDLYALLPEVFKSEFPEYEISAEVPASSVGINANAPARDYSFAMKKGAKTAAVVMVTPHNRDNNMAFKNAKAAAQAAGVPFINFYTHFPNERAYVVSRIKSFI